MFGPNLVNRQKKLFAQSFRLFLRRKARLSDNQQEKNFYSRHSPAKSYLGVRPWQFSESDFLDEYKVVVYQNREFKAKGKNEKAVNLAKTLNLAHQEVRQSSRFGVPRVKGCSDRELC